MMDLIPTLAAAVPPIVDLAKNAMSQPASSPSDGDRTDRIILSSSAVPAAPTPSPEQLTPRSHSGVVIPFQHLWYDLTGAETGVASLDIKTLQDVRDLSKCFRDAELVTLEAVIYPSAPAFKSPVTVDLVWLPADDNIDASSKVIKTAGATRFTCGGLAISNNGILPCNLGFVNGILKAPIPYSNTPKLFATFHQNPDASVKSKVAASVIVRGSLRLSHPIVHSGV